MSQKRPEGTSARELVPTAGEYPRPALAEPVVGEYYARPRPPAARTYLQMLQRQLWAMLITFVAVMAVGMGYILTRPSLYRSSAEILVTPIERGGGDGSLAGNITSTTRVRSVLTEVKMLQSKDLLDLAFTALSKELRQKGFGTTEPTRGSYPVAIDNDRDSDVVIIQVTAGHPVAAAAFANQIVVTNQARHRETLQAIAGMATEHVNDQLTACENELQQKRGEKADYQSRSGVVDVGTQASNDSTYLASLESQVAQAQVDLQKARLTISTVERELGRSAREIRSSVVMGENPLIQTIKNEINDLERQKATLLQDYLPNAPEVQAIDEQIVESRNRLAREQSRRVTVQTQTNVRNPMLDTLQQNYINAMVAEHEAKSRLHANSAYASQVRGRLSRLPQSEARLALLNSRIAELETTHAYLESQKQSLELSMSIGLPSVMPITNARANFSPVSPNVPASTMLLLVLASMLALGMAVVRDQFDDRVHTSDMVESLGNTRVLANLPDVRDGMKALVTSNGAPADLLEGYRILRGNILLSSLDPAPQVVLFTSANAGEGKSTTIANLAATTALSGKRVLVIDCDLRHPSLHLTFGLQNNQGLTAYLLGEATADVCIQQGKQEHLHVLTAGLQAGRAPELLSSPQLATLIAEMREQYDCILLDSTPLLHMSDSLQVASLADGVVLVVATDRTRQGDLQAAIRTLEPLGTPILGVVCNRSSEVPAIRWSAAA